MLPSFRLEDKVAIVTGAGRGIGRALAYGLTQSGANVVLLSRTEKDLNETAKLVESTGQKALVIPTDVTKREDVHSAIQQVVEKWGKIDILVRGPYGIHVNAIGPWYFHTPLTEKLLSDQTYVNEILAVTPLKRIGELPELVGPVVFLSSDAANYITGQTLFVDGGMTIHGF